MDSHKIGGLIKSLRLEKQLTQVELGALLHVSDRTVSKWERGAGCPDISLISVLSGVLGVDTERLLSGELAEKMNGGNMKRIKFYLCPQCGNVLYSTGEADISCCGRRLQALTAVPADGEHGFFKEEIENDCFLTICHPMEKAHFITFAAYASFDRVLLVKLYPEQNAELRMPRLGRGNLYLCCSRHGLIDCGRL